MLLHCSQVHLAERTLPWLLRARRRLRHAGLRPHLWQTCHRPRLLVTARLPLRRAALHRGPARAALRIAGAAGAAARRLCAPTAVLLNRLSLGCEQRVLHPGQQLLQARVPDAPHTYAAHSYHNQ